MNRKKPIFADENPRMRANPKQLFADVPCRQRMTTKTMIDAQKPRTPTKSPAIIDAPAAQVRANPKQLFADVPKMAQLTTRNAANIVDAKPASAKATANRIFADVPSLHKPRTNQLQGTSSSEQVNDLSTQLSALAVSDKLDDIVMYGVALRSSHHYFVIGEREALAVAHWSVEKSELSFSEYHVLTPIDFITENEDTITLLECTCKDSRSQKERLRALDKSLPLSAVVVANEKKLYCLHRLVIPKLNLGELIISADAIEDIDIEQHMNEPALLWSVRVHSSYGIVKRTVGGSMSCTTCKKTSCGHVATFSKNYKQFEIELPPPLQPQERCPVRSRREIRYSEQFLAGFKYPLDPCAIDLALSKLDFCEHGVTMKRVRERRCTVWNEQGRSYEGGVIYQRAAQCDSRCKISLDGSELGVINVNDDNVVEYSLLSNYMSFYERDGTPLVAFYDSLVKQNRRRGVETIPYEILYRAWTGFIGLLALDDASGFICEKCGIHPDVIVLDGTALACRKDLLPKNPIESVADLKMLHGISHKDRVFIKEKKTRTLVRWFANSGENKEKQMPIEEMRTMVQQIPDRPFQRLMSRLTSEDRTSAPEDYRLLLRELSKNTPVSGLLQVGAQTEDAIRALRGVAGGFIDIAGSEDLEVVKAMRIWYPGLLECLYPIRKSCGHLPPDVRGILNSLVEQYQKLHVDDGRTDQDYLQPESIDDSLGYFPNWPLVRGFGNYVSEMERGAKDTCTKLKHGHKSLAPGIMLYLCPHSVCYGFSLMDSYESPRMPFETFTMRYTPKNIVYDNACKLHVYCLLREPFRFAKTRFYVDRFHWFNHNACSIGYDMKRYLSDPIISDVNSQVNEQLNSRLSHLRRCLSYMSFANFTRSLKLFLYLRNKGLTSDQ